ncbi:hypothetical protein [Hymenobacter glacieicola]|uniref:Uncharacterized protein n=1 Tax=Hymenobacter glacieicola TaxID=1562124 RepID=A0ABQ1WYQ5_9BACT|nr:hypothetical protein [Hymenobacter glacieicola]GGG46798.1 hypothetical protein GCM10011378_23760 [Hymenobacter glacieicola]
MRLLLGLALLLGSFSPALAQFNKKEAATQLAKADQVDATNFAAVKDRIMVRVYPQQAFAKIGTANNVVRIDAEGTYTVLVLDMGTVFKGLDRATFTTWGISENEAFALGHHNVGKQQVEVSSRPIGDSLSIGLYLNDDYAAAYLLNTEQNGKAYIGKYGAVVCLPARGIGVIYQMNDPVSFVKMMQRTQELMQKFFSTQPGSISPDFYWYYQGRFTKINTLTTAQGQFTVIAPAGLAELAASQK